MNKNLNQTNKRHMLTLERKKYDSGLLLNQAKIKIGSLLNYFLEHI